MGRFHVYHSVSFGIWCAIVSGMSTRHPVHVVYGYPSGVLPVGEPTVKGFGPSDRAAYEDAKRHEQAIGLIYYFVRANGNLEHASQMKRSAGNTARERAAKRWAYFSKKR